MANLFILGNGFDIAHNLKTTYIDFKNYLDEKDPDFLKRIFEIYKYSFNRRYSNTLMTEPLDDEYESLWKTFEENMARIDDDSILNMDFEYGLEYEDPWMDGRIDTTKQILREEFEGVAEKLVEYLSQWIDEIDYTQVKKQTSKINPDYPDLFLCFNYTSVLEKIYEIEEICHIHGSVERDDFLIIGHNNEDCINALHQEISYFDLNSDALPLTTDLTEYLKYKTLVEYYEETLKRTDYHIKQHNSFFKNLKNIDAIYVVGHSLGDVDIPYFNEILKNINSDVTWNVYYYNENEKLKFEEKIKSLGVDNKYIQLSHSSSFFND